MAYRNTQAGHEVLLQHEDDAWRNTQAGWEVLFLSNIGPGIATAVSSSAVGPTYATLTGSSFDAFIGNSTVHAATIWKVRRTSDQVLVYQSTQSSTTGNLITFALSTGTLASNIGHEFSVTHKNSTGEVGPPGAFGQSFITSATTVKAWLKVVYLSTAGAELSSTLLGGSTGTAWTVWVFEELTFPAGCAGLKMYAYKTGTGLNDVEVRHVQVDRGNLASGYSPSFYRPELDDETRVAPSWKDLGTSTAASITVDWATAHKQYVGLDANAAIDFTGLEAGGDYVYYIEQASTVARTVTWSTAIKWASGTAPTLSTSTGSVDIIEFDAASTAIAHGSVKAKDSR